VANADRWRTQRRGFSFLSTLSPRHSYDVSVCLGVLRANVAFSHDAIPFQSPLCLVGPYTEMSKQVVSDFTWSYTEEPHRSRRKQILATHPEVRDLFGFDPTSKYWVVLSVALQFAAAWLVRDQSWLVIVVVAYVWGATINHSLNLAGHELSHNLFFDNPVHNTLFGFFANLPMPVAVTVYVPHHFPVPSSGLPKNRLPRHPFLSSLSLCLDPLYPVSSLFTLLHPSSCFLAPILRTLQFHTTTIHTTAHSSSPHRQQGGAGRSIGRGKDPSRFPLRNSRLHIVRMTSPNPFRSRTHRIHPSFLSKLVIRPLRILVCAFPEYPDVSTCFDCFSSLPVSRNGPKSLRLATVHVSAWLCVRVCGGVDVGVGNAFDVDFPIYPLLAHYMAILRFYSPPCVGSDAQHMANCNDYLFCGVQ